MSLYPFTGSLEDHLNKLRGLEKEVNAFKINVDELERYNQDVQEAMIFENRHTPYTMETLRVGWEQLLTSVARATNEVENQVRCQKKTAEYDRCIYESVRISRNTKFRIGNS